MQTDDPAIAFICIKMHCLGEKNNYNCTILQVMVYSIV